MPVMFNLPIQDLDTLVGEAERCAGERFGDREYCNMATRGNIQDFRLAHKLASSSSDWQDRAW